LTISVKADALLPPKEYSGKFCGIIIRRNLSGLAVLHKSTVWWTARFATAVCADGSPIRRQHGTKEQVTIIGRWFVVEFAPVDRPGTVAMMRLCLRWTVGVMLRPADPIRLARRISMARDLAV